MQLSTPPPLISKYRSARQGFSHSQARCHQGLEDSVELGGPPWAQDQENPRALQGGLNTDQKEEQHI